MENKAKSGQQDSTLNNAAARFRENPELPVRVLVSTATHLVPGKDYYERIQFIQNLICQHHWERDFDRDMQNFESYGAEFGFDNRACYFLVDHGKAPGGIGAAVPVLWYRWTGETLVHVHDPLPARIRRGLRKFPFTPPPTSRPRRIIEPRRLNPREQRNDIWESLRCDMIIGDEDFVFLKKYPEHAIWLERVLEPRLLAKLKSEEARWLEHPDIVSRRLDIPRGERPKDCTEMWDCECSYCY